MFYGCLALSSTTALCSYAGMVIINAKINYLSSTPIINYLLKYNEATASSYTILFTYLSLVTIIYIIKFKKTYSNLIGDNGERFKTVFYRVFRITYTSTFLGFFIFLMVGLVSRTQNTDHFLFYLGANIYLSLLLSFFCHNFLITLSKHPKEIAKKYKIH